MEQNTFGTNFSEPQKNNHLLGLLAGLGVGAVVGLILALLAMLLESEIGFIVYIGIGLVGYAVAHFVPNKSLMGIITGALSCGFAAFAYAFFLLLFGYWYVDGNEAFWIMLVIAVIYGGVMGYKGKKGFEND